MKEKREKKQEALVQQQECDGGSWDYAENCTRRCNNGGEFASEESCDSQHEVLRYHCAVWRVARRGKSTIRRREKTNPIDCNKGRDIIMLM